MAAELDPELALRTLLVAYLPDLVDLVIEYVADLFHIGFHGLSSFLKKRKALRKLAAGGGKRLPDPSACHSEMFEGACFGGQESLIRILKSKGPHIADGVYWACRAGRLNLAVELLGSRGDHEYMLFGGIKGGHAHIVRYVLDTVNLSLISDRTAEGISECQSKEILQIIMDKGYGHFLDQALDPAVRTSNSFFVEHVLSMGSPCDYKRTIWALALATHLNNRPLIDRLAEHLALHCPEELYSALKNDIPFSARARSKATAKGLDYLLEEVASRFQQGRPRFQQGRPPLLAAARKR